MHIIPASEAASSPSSSSFVLPVKPKTDLQRPTMLRYLQSYDIDIFGAKTEHEIPPAQVPRRGLTWLRTRCLGQNDLACFPVSEQRIW